MAFYFRSHTASGGAFYYRSNEVRNEQTVVGVDIITDYRSAFFNLDFIPVDGDSVTLPTVFQGSTITLESSGLYVIDPALPAGTQIPRTSYDASANATFTDYIEVFDDTGEQITVSGTGTVTASGSGAESTAGNVAIDSVGSLAATGSGAETASGATVIDGVGTVTTTGTSAGIDSGDVIIVSAGAVFVSGSVTGDPTNSGDVALNSAAEIIVSGFASGGSIDSGDVSISVPAVIFVDGFISAQNNSAYPTNRIFSFH